MQIERFDQQYKLLPVQVAAAVETMSLSCWNAAGATFLETRTVTAFRKEVGAILVWTV